MCSWPHAWHTQIAYPRSGLRDEALAAIGGAHAHGRPRRPVALLPAAHRLDDHRGDGAAATPTSTRACGSSPTPPRRCPLIVYRRQADNERRRASGRTADLLQAPAEGTTQASFVTTLLAHLLLVGKRATSASSATRDGRIEQLIPIDPSQVSVERREGRVVFTVTIDGRTREHGLDDIVHVKALSHGRHRRLRADHGDAGDARAEPGDAHRLAPACSRTTPGRPGSCRWAPSASREQAQILKEQWTTAHGGDRGRRDRRRVRRDHVHSRSRCPPTTPSSSRRGS